jgi:hypothetical protein
MLSVGILVMALQRRSNWTPAIVSNRDTEVRLVENIVAKPCVTSQDNQKIQHHGDILFSIGVALALALPAFIGLGIYIAAESIILRAS